MGSYGFFFGFTERLNDRYPDLFEQTDRESNTGPDLSGEASFSKKWAGYNSIAFLSGNDITKFEAVTQLPVHQCLTFLVFKKDQTIIEQQQIKKAQKMNH